MFNVVGRQLQPDGQLVGTTILGKGEGLPSNWFAKLNMWLYNKAANLNNQQDSEDVFVEGLKGNLDEVRAWRVGRVLLFRARKPNPKPVDDESGAYRF